MQASQLLPQAVDYVGTGTGILAWMTEPVSQGLIYVA